ncbi:unnamed protein product, partial [Adineta steineri]
GPIANKELLRLLVEFVSNTNLVKLIIKPIWNNHPHQDVRACPILTLLHFIGKTSSNENENIIWKILEAAAEDNYLPVVQTLFADQQGKSCRSLGEIKYSSETIFEEASEDDGPPIVPELFAARQRKSCSPLIKLKNSSEKVFETFINRIKFKKLYEKVQEECAHFNKEGNTLWEQAFEKMILIYKEEKTCSFDIIIDIIKKIMSRREEIDLNENGNGNDNRHDLPVYHRIQRVLAILDSHIKTFDEKKKVEFQSITPVILQFDKTLAYDLTIILIGIAESKEDLEDILQNLEQNLPDNYFEKTLIDLSSVINKGQSCRFIDQLNDNEKLQLAKWFIKDKNRTLFVFKFLLNLVFHESNANRDECKNLLRQMRQSNNLCTRRQAMDYIMPWQKMVLLSKNMVFQDRNVMMHYKHLKNNIISF